MNVFIIDDNIYKSEDFVNQSIYDNKIDSENLLHLATSYQWKGQLNLQQLTLDILNSKHSKEGIIKTYGFNHPEICIKEINEGLVPNIIIFDWEYGSETYDKSSEWLTEILKITKAFVFIYSVVRDEVPSFLNKHTFDKDADRFQLFLKGNSHNAIFTSEEFILQFILTRVRKNNKIKLGGVEFDFYENGYLKNPTDILYLEKIIGRQSLLEYLKEKDFSFTEKNIEQLIEHNKGVIFFAEDKNLLITSDSKILIDKFKPTKELSYVQVLKKYGLLKLTEVLEIGLVRV